MSLNLRGVFTPTDVDEIFHAIRHKSQLVSCFLAHPFMLSFWTHMIACKNLVFKVVKKVLEEVHTP